MTRNTSKLPPLTPDNGSAFPKGFRVQSAQIAALEGRINGQQKKLHDQELFVELLKKELHALKAVVREMGAPLRPSPLGREARKGAGL